MLRSDPFCSTGAWGTAIGNLIGDIFGGTLGPTSIAGFVGNFLLGYLPYAMWIAFFPFSGTSREWRSDSWHCWTSYILIAFISSASCAVVISTAADALGIVPYPILTKIITLNDTIASWIGIPLFISGYSVTKQQLGLFWADVMDEGDIGSPISGSIGAWLITLASLFGLLGGTITDFPTTIIGWVCTLAIIIGSFLL